MAKNQHFAEVDTDDSDVVVSNEVVVNDDLVSCRVKGTWVMYWGNKQFDFKDGQRYRIPRELFDYLRKNGNIYDTMA